MSAAMSGAERPRFRFLPPRVLSNRDAALDMAELGFPVFPAQSRLHGEPKRPMPGIKWSADATTDFEAIEAAWGAEPDAAVGMPVPPGFLVVDADGPEGVRQWRDLWAPHGGLPDLPHVLTPSGGAHYPFRLPKGVEHGNGLGSLKPKREGGKIDIRGGGRGYVIAQGSDMGDGCAIYSAANSDCPFLDAPELPAWLMKILKGNRHEPTQRAAQPVLTQNPAPAAAPAQAPRVSSARSRRDVRDHPRVLAWARKALEDELEAIRGAVEGGRNQQINDSAFSIGQLVQGGFIDEGIAENALLQAAIDNGYAIKERSAAIKTIRSGLEGGKRQPRQIPDYIEADIQADEDAAEFGRRATARVLARTDGEQIDPETGEVFEETTPGEDDLLPLIPMSAYAGLPVPPQRWLIPELIPSANVTLMSGEGGTGKSLLALQLAHSVVTGEPWLGFDIEQGKAIYLSAEDEVDELRRRLAAMGADFANLPGLIVAPLAGLDALLVVPGTGRDAPLTETKLFHILRKRIAEYRPSLLVLDTLADLFGGNEIVRRDARQFISMLRGVALQYDVTVVLLAHPSRAGQHDNSGESGSTAWNGSVRSRLYLFRPKDGDPNIRVLESKKANRAASGTQIFVRYSAGEFIREDAGTVVAGDKRRRAECAFLELLSSLPPGKRVSHNAGSNYAPAYFAALDGALGIGKETFKVAMNRLIHAGKIEIDEYGPPSRRRSYLRLAGAPAEGTDDDETAAPGGEE